MDWPPTRLLARQITGPYALHQEVLETLVKQAESIGLEPTRVVAIYPDDPRTTPADELEWTLGLVVERNFEGVVEHPFHLLEIPTQKVVAVETTMASMAAASHEIDAWIASLRLEQSGPTRVISQIGSDGLAEGGVHLVKPVSAAHPVEDLSQHRNCGFGYGREAQDQTGSRLTQVGGARLPSR